MSHVAPSFERVARYASFLTPQSFTMMDDPDDGLCLMKPFGVKQTFRYRVALGACQYHKDCWDVSLLALFFLKKGLKQRPFSEHRNRHHSVNANSWHSPYVTHFGVQKMASVLWLLTFPSLCNLHVEGVGMLRAFNASCCMCCTRHMYILFSCVLIPSVHSVLSFGLVSH